MAEIPAPVHSRIFAVVNWRRLVLAAPVLVALAFGLVVLLRASDATATTPKAALLDTPPVGDTSAGVVKGRAARDFIATTPDGSSIRLSDLRGKPVVINFWATWCTSCLTEMPELRDVQQEFGAENVHVLAVNSGESKASALEFLDFLAAPDFKPVFDPSLAVTDAYGVIGLSHSVFIDATGVIRATYTGQLSKELIREYIAAASSGTTTGEPPFKFRLPGSVEARTSVLQVEEIEHGLARLTSKRLRCDDSFCAAPAVDALAAQPGILAIDRDLASDPPAVTVTFEPQVMTLSRLSESLASLIEQQDDPLYQQPMTIEGP
ncbi:MAG: TlpA family protein disulfide reductase [Chloroflexi bacterium]|nr:TlpA family protein disulfide reductase [Chloroflexota bacterium]